MDDLEAMIAEDEPVPPPVYSDESYFPGSFALLQMMEAAGWELRKSAKVLDRLQGKDWHLIKQVYTFTPETMQDLVFEPALPVLAAQLPLPIGRVTAQYLHYCGGEAAIPVLVASCRSTNIVERINASALLQSFNDERIVEALFVLFKDPVPDVRFNAVKAAAPNWDSRFCDPLSELLRDLHPRIRLQAAQWLAQHETRERLPKYHALLNDPDPEVVGSAFQILTTVGRDTITREEALRLLGMPRMKLVRGSLSFLSGQSASVPMQISASLTSSEAAPLTTNRLSLARMAGLKILYDNGDAEAIALALPLLRDTNNLVRTRALGLLQTKTGQQFSAEDSASWESWWRTNKSTYKTTAGPTATGGLGR